LARVMEAQPQTLPATSRDAPGSASVQERNSSRRGRSKDPVDINMAQAMEDWVAAACSKESTDARSARVGPREGFGSAKRPRSRSGSPSPSRSRSGSAKRPRPPSASPSPPRSRSGSAKRPPRNLSQLASRIHQDMAAVQRDAGDPHRAGLDKKYRLRAWRRKCREQGMSQAPPANLMTMPWQELLDSAPVSDSAPGASSSH
jgi:hypothetical protein